MDATLDKSGQDTLSRYGPEVLCASWNPLVANVVEPGENAPDPAPVPAVGDADSFLSGFYRAQQG